MYLCKQIFQCANKITKKERKTEKNRGHNFKYTVPTCSNAYMCSCINPNKTSDLERFLQPMLCRCRCSAQILLTIHENNNLSSTNFLVESSFFFLHIGIGILRGWTMDRWLYVDTLMLIPTLKIHVFWYSGQTDRQTERWTETVKLIWGGARYPTWFFQVNRVALGVICDPGLWTAGLQNVTFLCIRRGIPFNNTQHSDQSRIGVLELGLQGSVPCS